MKTLTGNIPEMVDLLDELDKLRIEPDGVWNRGQIRVIEFLIKVRRGTVGEMKLVQWQRDIMNMHYASECRNV